MENTSIKVQSNINTCKHYSQQKGKKKKQYFGGFRNKDASRTATLPNFPNFGPKVTDPHHYFLEETLKIIFQENKRYKTRYCVVKWPVMKYLIIDCKDDDRN